MMTRSPGHPLVAALLGTMLITATATGQQATPVTAPAVATAPAGAAAGTAESGTDWQLWAGVAGMVVGTSFGITAIYSTVRVTEISVDGELIDYQTRIASDRNFCEAARAGEQVSDTGAPDPGRVADLCDEAETLEVLQGVALPTAVLFGLAGWVLVGTSDTWCGLGEDLAVSPWLGPEGGGIGVSARF